MLTLTYNVIEKKAARLCGMLKNISNSRMEIKLIDRSSRAGGGSLPLLDLPSKCVAIKVKEISADAIKEFMRRNTPPIIGRIEEDLFIMDLRTIQDDELQFIESAFSGMLRQ